MHDNELIFRHGDRPPFHTAFMVAFQHVLACFVAIIAPTIIVTGALGLQNEAPYLISLALLVSGISTLIQTQRVGPLGSGLLCVQGTSFSFVAALISAGLIARERGASDHEVLGVLFGICIAGSLIEMALGSVLHHLKRVITPTVTGVVVTLIGLSLISVGVTDIAGGHGAENPGDPVNLLLAVIVIGVVLTCQLSRHPMLRVGSVFVGLLAGCVAAALLGRLDLSGVAQAPLFQFPQPLRYGLRFDVAAFIPVAFIFAITAIETVGDLTGSSRASHLPTSGPEYQKRIRGGVLGDAFNSLLAGLLNTFPNTTFSQNTGIIHLTGVASRHIGLFVGGILVILGLIPAMGAVLQSIPQPVLGAATTLMFGLIAVSGIRMLAEQRMTRKRVMIIALSLGAGLGVELVPQVLSGLPELVQSVLSSSITTGGLLAILMHLVLPEHQATEEDHVSASIRQTTDTP